MNILYLAHRIPFPPDKGDKVRSFHQLEHLSKRHRVWCACFVDNPQDRRHVAPLGAYCQDVAAIPLRPKIATIRGAMGWACGDTITEWYYRRPAMRRAITRWCRSVDFDIVVAFSSAMAPYALRVSAGRRVLDLCDLDSLKWMGYAERSTGAKSMLFRSEGNRLATCERRWIRSFDASILISDAEAAALGDENLQERVHVVTNGVDLPAIDRQSASSQEAQPSTKTPTVGFVGMMNYTPNVDAVCWFANECWPAIRNAVPEATFRIVGRSPMRAVRDLEATPGVCVVGAVDDVATELRTFDVSVAPMRIARGLQNKVLEAMAAQRPVVLTKVAAEGIAARDGHDFVIADRPNEIAQDVIALLGDASNRERLGLSARRFVALNHRWEAAMLRFELIATGMIERTAESQAPTHACYPIRREPTLPASF